MEYTDRYKAFCKRMSIYRKLMDYDQAKMAVRVGFYIIFERKSFKRCGKEHGVRH